MSFSEFIEMLFFILLPIAALILALIYLILHISIVLGIVIVIFGIVQLPICISKWVDFLFNNHFME